VSGDDVTAPITINVGLMARTVLVSRSTSPLTLCEVEVFAGE